MISGTYYCPGDTLCVGVFAVHCVSYSIFIKPTSMSSSPLWSLLSQRLAHLVTMLHCLLQEQRLRRTEFTVRTLKSVTCTCIKPEVLLLLLSPSIPLFPLEVDCIWNWSHAGVSGKHRLVHWWHWSGNSKTEKHKAFCPQWPFFELARHTIQRCSVASIFQVNFTNG